MVKKINEILCDTYTFYKIQISPSIKIMSLEHSHSHLFLYCLWPLLCYNSRGEQLRQRTDGWRSLRYFLSGPLQKTCVDSWLRPQTQTAWDQILTPLPTPYVTLGKILNLSLFPLLKIKSRAVMKTELACY